MPHPPFSHDIKIPFQDIDAAGVVFFGHLFRYAHEAYERFMDRLGHNLGDLLAKGDYLLPLVHAEADYKQPLRLNEAITVELHVKRLGESSFTLGYRFLDDERATRATAETVHVVIDKASKKPCAIPQPLTSALEADFHELASGHRLV